MRVHVSREEDDKNLFVTQLRSALASHPSITRVQCGADRFRAGPDDEDVLHIHWPEHLCPNPSRSRLRRYGSTLRKWHRSSAAIVVTVHNEYPHYRDTPFYRAVYRLTYQYADGLVHLGDRSKAVVRRRYEACLRETAEAVIPHGMYSWYPQTTEEGPTRSTYGYGATDTVVLAFGSIRRPEELELLLSGFEAADVPDKQLLVAGGVVWPSRLTLRHYALRLRTLLAPVQLVEGFVPHEDVPGLFNLADVVVIPRTDALNSGNVALGFTFGKVVVGPDTGVIGETLRETGNPVFDPTEPTTLGRALEQARAPAAEGKGEDNRTYAETHLDWDTIADRHVQFFTSLTRNEAIL
jgi:glycosyltransferase involved in cell wall biosynthesis